MKLSKYFAVCAVTLWSANAFAPNIAGIDVNPENFPHTAEMMQSFVPGLKDAAEELNANINIQINFLKNARDIAFSNGNPKDDANDFLDKFHEKFTGPKSVDPEGLSKVLSARNLQKFNRYINRLENAARCALSLDAEFVKMSKEVEGHAKNNLDLIQSSYVWDWVLQDPSNVLETITRDTLRTEINLSQEFLSLELPICKPGSPLEKWLIEEKEINYEKFMAANAAFSIYVSDYFNRKLYGPFVEIVSLVALSSSDPTNTPASK